ncbi:MAG TPA: ferritin-like domain-containing protein [Ohtaekwangia sp.]
MERKQAKKSSRSASADPQLALIEFFTDALKDMYWAESHLVKALPKMQKAATSEELQQAFADHTEQTKTHVERLEQVFQLLDKKPQAKKCEAMEGLLKEGQSVIEDTEKGTATRDVALIIAAQKVEHYEIASYGGLAQLAKTLELGEIKDILGSILDEEKGADLLLTDIAENKVNYEAVGEEA